MSGTLSSPREFMLRSKMSRILSRNAGRKSQGHSNVHGDKPNPTPDINSWKGGRDSSHPKLVSAHAIEYGAC